MKLYKRVAKQRRNRAFRVRNRIRRSVSTHPRLTVFRSNKHIYAQLIDDVLGRTIVSASTHEKDFPGQSNGGNKGAAEQVGKLLAQRAVEKGVTQVSFDRGAYRYHGRVAALADAARAGGLQF